MFENLINHYPECIIFQPAFSTNFWILISVAQETGIDLGCFSSTHLSRVSYQASSWDSTYLQTQLVLEDWMPSSHFYWQFLVGCWQTASVLCHMVISTVLLLTWYFASPRVMRERQRQRQKYRHFGVKMFWKRIKKILNIKQLRKVQIVERI